MAVKKTKKVVDNLALLCTRGQELSSINDPDILLDRVLTTAMEVCKATAASVLLLDKSHHDLYFRAVRGKVQDKLRKMRFKEDKGIAGWVAASRESVVVNDISKDPRHYGFIDDLVDHKTRNLICVPIVWENETIGVLEVLNKSRKRDFTEQDQEYLLVLANQAASSLYIASMMDKLHNFYVNMVEILMMAAETLGSNQGHSVRVARLAMKIAREMGVSEKEYKDIYYASLIHDIGQIKVARDQIVGGEKLVPTLGAAMIRPIKMLRNISEIVERHHERWDGSGHPDGLEGKEIPLASRIIALAEEYEEWKEEDVYRRQFDPFSKDDFFRHIVKTHDPAVVEAFKEVRRKGREKSRAGRSA